MKRSSLALMIALLAPACGDDDALPDGGVASDASLPDGGVIDAGGEDAGGIDAGPDGPIDISDAVFTETSGDCADHAGSYFANVTDIQRSMPFMGEVDIAVTPTSCALTGNAIPNHDFNEAPARFATPVAELATTFSIPRAPTMAASPTSLTLMTYDAVMLNGVVVDLLAAGCFGVGDGMIGCFDIATPWRFDPMSPMNDFGTDPHNAHTQPDGRYHYHGDPMAMYGDAGPDPSPVIGFAADGFPIYGPYFDDGTTVRAALSGYTLRTGTRPDGPGGTYDGSYVDDWEFTDAGDLDECNGMTIDGQYGYYVTSTYPWILKCFRGTPDASFNKMMR